MDRIMEQLSKLQELSDDELKQLEELTLSEFETTQGAELSAESVAAMTKLADAVEAVRTEQARRVTEAAALQEAAAEAAARVNPAEASDAPVNPDDEVVEGEDPNAPPDDENAEVDENGNPIVPVAATATAAAAAEQPEAAEAATEPAPEPEPAPAEPTAEAAVIPEPAAEAAAEEPAPEAPTEPAAEAAVEAPAEPEPAAEAEAATESPPAAEASEAAAPEPDVPAEAEASTSEEASTTNEVQEDTVTADAAPQGTGELTIEPPAGRQPQIKPATTLSITAGADVPGFSAGAKLKDSMEVADAFQKRLHSLRHVHGGDGEQHIVASYRQEFPSDRALSPNDPLENTDKIQGVTSLEAVTAAAGICLPLETRYDLGCDIGVTDRPVRDALARFGADRGGVRFFTPPALTDYAAATGFWRGGNTPATKGTFHTYGPDGTTVTAPADAKPCLEATCSAELEAYIEAVTLCLTFNNLTARTFPELIKRQNELALVAHARVAENYLLSKLEAGSTAIAAPAQKIGMARELFNILGAGIAAYRHKHRMDSVSPLRMVAPAWVRDMVKADLTMQMPGDGLDDTIGAADAKIDAWFRSRGVNITWHLDGVGPVADTDTDGSGTDTSTGFTYPTTLEFGLWAEGTWLFLDGGTLDLGVIRDSSLVSTNQYKEFVETFEGVANVGCDSYWVTATLKPTGQAASLVDTH